MYGAKPMVAKTKSKQKTKKKPVGDPQAFAQAAECLKTLAHPVRLRMVQMLLYGRYSVGELAEDAGFQTTWPRSICD